MRYYDIKTRNMTNTYTENINSKFSNYHKLQVGYFVLILIYCNKFNNSINYSYWAHQPKKFNITISQSISCLSSTFITEDLRATSQPDRIEQILKDWNKHPFIVMLKCSQNLQMKSENLKIDRWLTYFDDTYICNRYSFEFIIQFIFICFYWLHMEW